MKLSQARKALVAVIGVATEAVTLGLFTGTAARIVGIAAALATAAGVYAAKNAPKPTA